ncbi:MAG: patatin-like phospholipase family protein [Actinobacteria bacterium]|nr:patatin-like phospholipase family protein [Actinomycetota bacterium]
MSVATRRGLVLGAGGILGAAWMVGALQALQDEIGVDVREFEAFVGTSAGSILAALLGAGVSVADLVNHQRGDQLESGRLTGFHFDYAGVTASDRSTRSRAGLGSRELLIRNARQLRQLPPTAVLSAFLPEGRGNLDAVGALISHVVPDGWVSRDGVTVVALDYDTGERVPFGRPGARSATLREAVMASCAIPGWYQPVRIGDHRFIDGGAWSSTNLDLLAGQGLDEVFVLAPQVSFDADAPTQWATRLERQWRNRVTRRVLREVTTVHRHGTEVTILGPGREDLEAIGGNLMDLTRRPAVIETSLRTSAVALRDPDPIPGRHNYEGHRQTLTRIYIPLNASGLRSLSTHGALGGAPFVAHAVTKSVRASAPNAGMDEWEYTALDDAAQTSGWLLTPGESRRIVAAADVSSDLVGSAAPVDSGVESAVSISDSVALKRIASFHVDDDAAQDDGLLWYDVTELPVLLALM